MKKRQVFTSSSFLTLAVFLFFMMVTNSSYAQWTTSGDTIYRLNGNVGIGTTTPSEKLQVNGNLSLGLQNQGAGKTLQFHQEGSTGSGTNHYINFGESGRYNLFNIEYKGTPISPDNVLNIRKESTNLMTFTESGHVGIGTTTPSEKLEINGGISITGRNATNSVNNFYNCLQFKGLPCAAIVYNPGETNELMFGFNQNGHFYWGTGQNAGTPNTYYMHLNSERLTLNGKELELVENGIALSGKYGIGFHGNAPYDTIDPGDGAKIYYDAVFGGASSDWLVIEKTDGNGPAPDGGIVFTNKGQDNTRETALAIRGSGNVGIGTTTPSEKLDVAGDVKADTVKANFFVGDGSLLTGIKEGTWDITGNNLHYTAGNVGIGTTAPTKKLDVNGNINIAADSAYQIGGKNVLRMQAQEKNLFIGKGAGAGISTGYTNLFVGDESGKFNTTGYNNLFLGYRSGQQNTGGNHNLFMGSYSGASNSTGIQNSFIGYQSGQSNTEGSSNLFIGNQSGYSSTTGNGNVFLGYQAGYNETGSNKLYIENSNSATPLIYGEFDNEMLRFNGDVGIGAAPTGGYALYVNGTTFCTSGAWTASDRRYKKNIAPIAGALELVQHMQGSQYEFKTGAFKSKKLVEGKQYGFIAQELKEVLPELVRADGEGHYAINYDGVTPVLAEAIKELASQNSELQSIVEAQNEKIEELEGLKEEVAELKQLISLTPTQNSGIFSASGAKLYQNSPNPFNNQTEIRYFLPDNTETATLLVLDMNGKQLKSYELTQRGSGNVVIYGNDLRAGMYLYALMANNKLVDTKRMVLTE